VKLTNEFIVPVPVHEAWPVLLDVERIIPCMPGAEFVGAVGKNGYKGRVSVQLGPVWLTFEGIAKFVDVDDSTHRARVEAQGTDKKGRGGAHAKVAFQLEPSGTASRVVIDTDLQLSGSIAQYGRASGLIAGIAKELVGQFADNLGNELRASQASANAVEPTPGDLPQPKSTVKPISGFSLTARVVWSSLTHVFQRLFARG
jgi:carbon monoxide dehydrogenase subunit G